MPYYNNYTRAYMKLDNIGQHTQHVFVCKSKYKYEIATLSEMNSDTQDMFSLLHSPAPLG